MYESIGQADSLFEDNEYDLFDYMKKNKFTPISVEEFTESINVDSFVEDEGWFPEDIKQQDPDVIFYKGQIGSKKLIGINHSGVDQIFTINSLEIKKEEFQLVKIKKRFENDSLSWALLPENSVESIKRTGKENKSELDGDLTVIRGIKGVRYQLRENDEIVAAMFVVDSTIDTIYTAFEKRKQSLSKKIIEKALEDFPNLKHSDIQTDLGEKYSKNSKLKRKMI